MPHALHLLVFTVAGWLNCHQEDLIDYLREENRVLREQLGGRALRLRIRYHHTPDEAVVDRGLCATVSLANSVCLHAGLGPDRPPPDLDLANSTACCTRCPASSNRSGV